MALRNLFVPGSALSTLKTCTPEQWNSVVIGGVGVNTITSATPNITATPETGDVVLTLTEDLSVINANISALSIGEALTATTIFSAGGLRYPVGGAVAGYTLQSHGDGELSLEPSADVAGVTSLVGSPTSIITAPTSGDVFVALAVTIDSNVDSADAVTVNSLEISGGAGNYTFPSLIGSLHQYLGVSSVAGHANELNFSNLPIIPVNELVAGSLSVTVAPNTGATVVDLSDDIQIAGSLTTSALRVGGVLYPDETPTLNYILGATDSATAHWIAPPQNLLTWAAVFRFVTGTTIPTSLPFTITFTKNVWTGLITVFIGFAYAPTNSPFVDPLVDSISTFAINDPINGTATWVDGYAHQIATTFGYEVNISGVVQSKQYFSWSIDANGFIHVTNSAASFAPPNCYWCVAGQDAANNPYVFNGRGNYMLSAF
jgi:hypothetical protein